jgi:hypothetical protein
MTDPARSVDEPLAQLTRLRGGSVSGIDQSGTGWRSRAI